MKIYERYLTPEEAAVRLGRTEGEIWRMLETGILPALLRGQLTSKDGTPIGFDFARLPPEGVVRVVDQGGDDFTLEWTYAYGNGKASCFPARKSSIRVLWEPSLFSEITGSKDDSGQTAPAVRPDTVLMPPQATALPMKRDGLVKAWIHLWPTIEADLGEASRNGLSVAKAGNRRWDERKALEWARSSGKLNMKSIALTPEPADPMAALFEPLGKLSGRTHRG